MERLTHSRLPVITGKPWPRVRYFCTTREGGVSTGSRSGLNLALHVGDDPALVAENRRRVQQDLPANRVWLEQVHGVQVFDADKDHAVNPAPAKADAAVTTTANRVLCIMSADCLPVVVSDLRGQAIGVAHAGWRGLAGGVLENTLAALHVRLPHAQWRAWLGPAISQQHFEVGDEVRQAFETGHFNTGRYFRPGPGKGKWMADLAGLARERLRIAGVAHVEPSGCCTYSQAETFYSHRRDPASGRMATFVWLEPPI